MNSILIAGLICTALGFIILAIQPHLKSNEFWRKHRKIKTKPNMIRFKRRSKASKKGWITRRRIEK